MTSTFRGRFESKLDQKGRLSIPSAYRDAQVSSLSLVVTNSQFHNHRCLDVYSLAAWQNLENKISRMSQLNSDVQAFTRFYLASGQILQPDSHNRILLPSTLREYAGLKSQVQLVGLGSKFEIWSQPQWNKLFSNLAQGFSETLIAVSQLDKGEES